jgi:LmbE family N-acetylglucosaminyl deacetylase
LRTATPAAAFDLTTADRVVMVTAHPDDETLAAGATLAAVARVAEVHLISLTNGESAIDHLGFEVADLAARRRAELVHAARDLGVSSVQHCGLPDGGLIDVPEDIDTALSAVARERVPTHILSVWWADPHPDHQAAGEAALRLAAHHGIPVAGFPIWAPHWSDPHTAVDPATALVMSVDAKASNARTEALARYTSQTEPLSDELEPVLPAEILQWTTEIAIRP